MSKAASDYQALGSVVRPIVAGAVGALIGQMVYGFDGTETIMGMAVPEYLVVGGAVAVGDVAASFTKGWMQKARPASMGAPSSGEMAVDAASSFAVSGLVTYGGLRLAGVSDSFMPAFVTGGGGQLLGDLSFNLVAPDSWKPPACACGCSGKKACPTDGGSGDNLSNQSGTSGSTARPTQGGHDMS